MQYAYFERIDPERRDAFLSLYQTVKEHLPEGFMEHEGPYGINFSVPLETYPKGYHCDPIQPLPFITIAAQKSHLALYHMGVYARKDLLDWFTEAFQTQFKRKPDMGKSCIRIKKYSDMPLELIGSLCSKMTPQDWITCYEVAFRSGGGNK
jgi:hypothetical protein